MTSRPFCAVYMRPNILWFGLGYERRHASFHKLIWSLCALALLGNSSLSMGKHHSLFCQRCFRSDACWIVSDQNEHFSDSHRGNAVGCEQVGESSRCAFSAACLKVMRLASAFAARRFSLIGSRPCLMARIFCRAISRAIANVTTDSRQARYLCAFRLRLFAAPTILCRSA